MSATNVLDMDQLETKPNSYWGTRVREFIKRHPEDAMDRIKQSLLNESAAWSVFAALLMTVGFTALTISASNFVQTNEVNSEVGALYVIFNSLSGGVTSISTVKRYIF